MYPDNAYVIRRASSADRFALHGLARTYNRSPLREPVLIGEIHGRVAAAVSLSDMRALADQSLDTAQLGPMLLKRARTIRVRGDRQGAVAVR